MKVIKKLEDRELQVMKVWLVDGWKYYVEELDEGGQKMATFRYRSWIAVEVADVENGNPRLL